jgi:Tfp pilus assembly protein PilX
MDKFKKVKINNGEKGFALLFAVITASVLLTIGLSIFNISLKELLLSTSSRDSQIAFYAADSARECVLFNDIKYSSFTTCTGGNCTDRETEFISGTSPLTCGAGAITLSLSSFNSGTKIYKTTGTFLYSEDLTNSLGTIPEADFIVTKEFDGNDIKTTIETFGHNAKAGERRLERGLLQTY